ncbi:MAG: hypothetical protein OXR67_01730 [Chloroflexota bacterium]|nr:hypothetical protein [Chloroflexota bacterium]
MTARNFGAAKKANPSTRRNWLLDRIRLDRSLGVSTLWEQYTARYKGGYRQFLDDYEAAMTTYHAETKALHESLDLLADTRTRIAHAIDDATARHDYTGIAQLLLARHVILGHHQDTAP